MRTYSYCNATDECLEDVWNYLNKPCEDANGWVQGRDLDLETCSANSVACPDFNATLNDTATYKNMTWTLPQMG